MAGKRGKSDEFVPTWWDISHLQIARETRQRRVNLSRLPPAEKREAWRRIKSEQPALAALLQSDGVQEMIRMFNAEVWVDE